MNEQIVMILGVLGAVVWAAVRLIETWLTVKSDSAISSANAEAQERILKLRQEMKHREREFVSSIVTAVQELAPLMFPTPERQKPVPEPVVPREKMIPFGVDLIPAGEERATFIDLIEHFKPTQLRIFKDPDAFVVTSIKIAGLEQLVENGSVPCEAFSDVSLFEALEAPVLRPGEKLEIRIKNVSSAARPFRAVLYGLAEPKVRR